MGLYICSISCEFTIDWSCTIVCPMNFYIKFLIFKFILLFVLFQTTGAKSQSYEEEISCLVEALYFEARGESFSGQLAVGTVILNRVQHNRFPDTICEVVHEGHYRNGHPIKNRCSFSYYCDGKPERVEDLDAEARSADVAFFLMEGGRLSGLNKSLHYHATYVNPKWNRDYKRLMQVDNHIFYGERK